MSRIWIGFVFSVLIVTLAVGSCAGGGGIPPATAKQPVTTEYHGVKVTEDYRWLENAGNPVVGRWLEEQNRYSRAYLDGIPARGPIAERLGQLYTRSARYFSLDARGGLLFAMKEQPPKSHPVLVVLESADNLASERVVVDTDALYPDVPTAIDWYKPSLDGRLVAVSLSERGSENGTVRVFEVATGKPLSDLVPRAQYATAGGDLAWNSEGTGFYYTRYPYPGERPDEDLDFYQQVYFHKMGTSATQDRYVIGQEFPKIAEIEFKTTDDGSYVVASVANGDGGEFAYYIMDSRGLWVRAAEFADKVVSAVPGKDGNLYLLSHRDAPRGKVVAVPLAAPDISQAVTVVPQGEAVIKYFELTGDRLYVVDVVGGPHQVRVFDLAGRADGTIPIRPVSAVWQIVPLPNRQVLYSNETYLEPVAYYRYDPVSHETTKTALAMAAPADFSDTEVIQEFAVSKDGTLVPLMIVRSKGTTLDGANAVLLAGYGGYGISMTPGFDDWLRLWIEQGGVYAVAGIRGGGEYGEEWHLAGNLTKKQNVFDDFAACAQHLIDAGYTNPSRLAIEGTSNGGLLVGAALVQHPELFRAVVSHVGIYDALRTELSSNGEFNVTEFGTVKDPDQFRALYAYSPYHHVVDGTAYPAVLMTGGENDIRVEPMQSRKMTARLQVASASGLPVLLSTNPNAGHGMIGIALGDLVAGQADVLAFLFDQLGMAYRPPGR